MTKNPKFQMPYFKKVVGGILKFDPGIYISCKDELDNLLAECFFFHLNDGKLLNDVFLLQNVYNWNASNLYCAQIWKLKPVSMCNINTYWHE